MDLPAYMSELELVDVAEPRIEGDTVIRTGKFFECGQEYTDMNGLKFGLTTDEADAILPTAPEGYLNVEHMPTFLDGVLGKIRRYWRQGKDILAEYAINKHLHALTQGKPVKISSEWDPKTKVPLGAAFVLNPAVKDAVMLAFTEYGAAFRRTHMQRLHDMACDCGAICLGRSSYSERAAFLTADERKAIQHVHDHCAMNGADCHPYAARHRTYTQPIPTESAREQRAQENTKMSLLDALKAKLRRAGASEDVITRVVEDTEPVTEPATIDFSQSPEYVAMKQKMDEQTALLTAQSQKLAEQQQEQRQERQTAQFKENCNALMGIVRQMKMTPAEADEWKEVAKDDPVAFASVLPILQKREPLPQYSRELMRLRQPWETGAENAGEKLVKLAEQKAKAEGISMQEALIAVGQEQRELAEAHKANVQGSKEG